MSIFDIFSSGKPENQPAQPTATPTPAPPGNIPDVDPSAAPPGTSKSVETKADSPLDQFKDLWEPIKTEKNADGTPKPLDPTKLRDSIGKADFSKIIPQENLSKISQGGEEAIAAFADSMNKVAQQVMFQSTLAANKMIETSVAQAIENQNKNLPNLVKKQGLSESLKSKNPVFSNPAVKPVIEAVQSQLAAKYPDATVSELTEMAQNFVTVMGEAFNPPPTPTTKTSPNDIDWDSLMFGPGQ